MMNDINTTYEDVQDVRAVRDVRDYSDGDEDEDEDEDEDDLSQDAPKRVILCCTCCGYQCSHLRAVSALMEATVDGRPWDMR